MNRFIAIVSLSLCFGATTAAAQPNTATIQITRPSTYLYALPDAYIDVNGVRATNLANGDTYKGSVKAGTVTIVVTNWQSPGRSSVSFKASPGKTYRFTVKPRTESFAVTMAAGIIGQALEGGGMFQITRN